MQHSVVYPQSFDALFIEKFRLHDGASSKMRTPSCMIIYRIIRGEFSLSYR